MLQAVVQRGAARFLVRQVVWTSGTSARARPPGKRGGAPARSRLAFSLALRARSRLYRSQILQVNMRLKALVEIYIIYPFAQVCNLNFLSKSCQRFATKFAKFHKFKK